MKLLCSLLLLSLACTLFTLSALIPASMRVSPQAEGLPVMLPATPTEPLPESPAVSEPASVAVPEPPEAPEPEPEPEPEEEPEPDPLEPEEVVEAYFETLYAAYIDMEPAYLDDIMDMSMSQNQRFEIWTRLMNQRRSLIDEYGLAYVETEMMPYTVTFLDEDELEDDRVSFWSRAGAHGTNGEDPEDFLLHFVVTGEAGHAYPPFMAVNSQQSVRIRLVDGQWKIAWHYYPGAVRAFRNSGIALEPVSDVDMLEALFEEFAEPADISFSAGNYSGEAAALYALEYAEGHNPDFYRIGDWMGNCANFISQCVWAGLHGGGELTDPAQGRHMTSQWYSGGGGGSPAWENVGYFWSFAVNGFASRQPEGVLALLPGDIAQTRSPRLDEDEGFSHSLILVDRDTLMFAQNSPGNFVYYSDLVNTEFRFLRPVRG